MSGVVDIYKNYKNHKKILKIRYRSGLADSCVANGSKIVTLCRRKLRGCIRDPTEIKFEGLADLQKFYNNFVMTF